MPCHKINYKAVTSRIPALWKIGSWLCSDIIKPGVFAEFCRWNLPRGGARPARGSAMGEGVGWSVEWRGRWYRKPTPQPTMYPIRWIPRTGGEGDERSKPDFEKTRWPWGEKRSCIAHPVTCSLVNNKHLYWSKFADRQNNLTEEATVASSRREFHNEHRRMHSMSRRSRPAEGHFGARSAHRGLSPRRHADRHSTTLRRNRYWKEHEKTTKNWTQYFSEHISIGSW